MLGDRAWLAIAPLLYSLNRGAWIGVGLSVGYLAIRFALRGQTALLGGLCAVIAIAALLVVADAAEGRGHRPAAQRQEQQPARQPELARDQGRAGLAA